ncbi:MAG: hypothetical protein AB8C95_00055 [Phycisphaeraceae bacterium]
MLRLALVTLLIVMSGCAKAQLIDRPALDQRYLDTQLAEGVLSIVPLRLDPNVKPPVVVNWWYTGTDGDQHQLVYRELTWDDERKPIGKELRYRIQADQLAIASPFPATKNDLRWLPLYDAAANGIEPPADLPTARKAPNPITNDPIRLPQQPVLPAVD